MMIFDETLLYDIDELRRITPAAERAFRYAGGWPLPLHTLIFTPTTLLTYACLILLRRRHDTAMMMMMMMTPLLTLMTLLTL